MLIHENIIFYFIVVVYCVCTCVYVCGVWAGGWMGWCMRACVHNILCMLAAYVNNITCTYHCYHMIKIYK